MSVTIRTGEIILFRIINKNFDLISINRAATNVRYHYMLITVAFVRFCICHLTLRKRRTQKYNSPARCYFAQA